MARKWLQSVDWENVASTGSDVLGALSGGDEQQTASVTIVEKEETPAWIYWAAGTVATLAFIALLR